METHVQDTLLGMDDETFCEMLPSLIAGEEADMRGEGLRALYAPAILRRLALIRQRPAHLYEAVFLPEVRTVLPQGTLNLRDLETALRQFPVGDAEPWATQEDRLSPGDVSAETFLDAGRQMHAEGLPRGVSPGWATLARHYTVRPDQFTVVTGHSSAMKSSFVNAMAINLAREHGWHIGLFSPEHYPLGTLMASLAELYAGITFDEHAGGMDGRTAEKAMQWVAERFHLLAPPDEEAPTLEWLLALARLQVQRYHIQGLILDPWNEIDHDFDGRVLTETRYISKALSMIRRFARAQRVHVWIVVHPTKNIPKAVKGPYKGKYPPPALYDVAGSAHWRNKADNGLSIWRDDEADSGVIEVHIQKVRNRAVGRPGMVRLRRHPSCGRFADYEVGHEEDRGW